MCGIAGIFAHRGGRDAATRLIEEMTGRLQQRGPDGAGYHVDDTVALGHRRLSIIDLEGGDQPIYNEDGSIAIVFNGEIYNYVEIREELISKGHTFKTVSDTEVIVHLYEEQGVECLQALNGMFAFALWDQRRQRLFIARDRMGEKPLYYADLGGTVYFGSELKSLLAVKTLPREVDPQAMDDYLSYGYVPCPKSIFKSVRKLPAAHYMTITDGRVEIAPYWNIAFGDANFGKTESQVLEELRELVNHSIRIRLRSDVPVGAFLSGGIDSSLIVSHAAMQSQRQLSTFSIGFSEQDYDELAWARKVAERYDTDHHEFVISEIDADLFPRIVSHFDEPFADPSAVPTWYVTREAARLTKVVLSGDAGDELFCGYGRYRTRPVDQLVGCVPAGIRRMAFGGAAAALPDHIPGRGWLSRMAVGDSEQWQRTVGIFDSVERGRLWRPEHLPNISLDAGLLEPWFRSSLDFTSRRMFADQNTYLTDDILVKVDRNSMWHSLEVRVPLLDHRIVEYANNLPLSMKYHDGILKYPLKKLLEGKVPDELITRRKTGFGMPIKHWLKGHFYEFSRDLLLSSDARIHAWLDQQAIGRLIEGNRNGKRDLSRRIWSLLWLEQWLRSVA